jgi:NADH-quinone oxidoreductase subunit M
MVEISQAHLLSWVTFVPLLTGIALLAVDSFASTLGSKGLPAQVWRGIGLGSALFTFLLSLLLWTDFDAAETAFQFVEYVPWLPQFGVNYFVGIDGISLLLIILTTFLMPLVLLGSWNDIKKSLKSYIFFMLFLETGMIGTFAALNLFQFYVFWELMLIPMYFIIGVWGGPRRIYAAVKFFLFTMFGSLLMLVALLVVYYLHFEQFGFLNLDLVAAPGSDAPAVLDAVIASGGETVWWKTQPWLFAAFALAFGIKVPMVPFHTWLPDAHVEAPTAGSVILAGVLLKMGTYGFIRFSLPIMPDATHYFLPYVLGLSIIGVIYGACVALMQTDWKKLVAYSSVSHLGFTMVGIFALNSQGLSGGVLQMLNHGLSTGALFLIVGMVYERRHTRLIADYGGLWSVMPIFAVFFLLMTLSSIGMPGIPGNGFVGEFTILLGAFRMSEKYWAVLASTGIVLGAVYMLWLYQRVFWGEVDREENKNLVDLNRRELATVVPLVVLCFWIGLYPKPFLEFLEKPMTAIAHKIQPQKFALIETPAELPARGD